MLELPSCIETNFMLIILHIKKFRLIKVQIRYP